MQRGSDLGLILSTAHAQSPAPKSCVNDPSRAWWTRRAARTVSCAARRPALHPQVQARSSVATTTSPTCPPAIFARPPAFWAAPLACAIRASVQVRNGDGVGNVPASLGDGVSWRIEGGRVPWFSSAAPTPILTPSYSFRHPGTVGY